MTGHSPPGKAEGRPPREDAHTGYRSPDPTKDPKLTSSLRLGSDSGKQSRGESLRGVQGSRRVSL